jgi:predicted acetyltransferase
MILVTEEGRHSFFIRVDGKLAGFALLSVIASSKQNQTIISMAEFFVMKKYRKLGVGEQAAAKLFNKFSGNWKVAQMEINIPAQSFWKKTIERYTNNNYKVIREDDWEGPILTFSTVI